MPEATAADLARMRAAVLFRDDEATARRVFGLPPAQIGEACRNCARTIQPAEGSSTGWTHIGGWQGVRCPGDLCGASPAVADQSPDETLAAVDAAVEGRCAGPGCGTVLTERHASSYWCSPGCQESWQRVQVGRPSPGSAPVRGSREVDPPAMRWRPDLVTAFDDSGLELVEEIADRLLSRTRRWYRHADGRWFLRLDDFHRFVGAWVPDDATEQQRDDLWRRLERELGDRRRLNPDAAGPPPALTGQSAEEFVAEVARRWWYWWMQPAEDVERRIREAAEGAEGERAVLSGRPDPRAPGTVFWLPDPPADPEAPTPAELARSAATWHFAAPPSPRLALGDRITVRASPGSPEVTELEVTEVRPDGGVVTGPADRDGTVTAIRRVGEQIVRAGAGAVAAFGVLPAGVRRAVAAAAQAESDRVALRAVCTDEAMYERALAAAEERGMSVRTMVDVVAVGWYTEHGWVPAAPFTDDDVDPTGRFPVPEYTQLPPNAYEAWCSLPAETRTALLRTARNVAATGTQRQEVTLTALLMMAGGQS